MIRVGIVGGTGYTGVELMRLLARHPSARLQIITSRSQAGAEASEFLAARLPAEVMDAVLSAERESEHALQRLVRVQRMTVGLTTSASPDDLDQLVQAAFQQNLSLRAAGLRVLQARNDREISGLNLLPQSQTFFGQYVRNQISRSAANVFPGVKHEFDDWKTGFDLSWEIDLWGRIRRAVEAADANIDVQIESYDDILVTLIGV